MDYQQKKRYDKIFYEELYLLDKNYDKNNLIFKISGSTKNLYTVTIYFTNNTIFCDCPDAKSWAKKSGSICKHSCFVLFKVLKSFKPDETEFFNHLQFNKNEMDIIKKNFDRLVITETNDFIDKELIEKYKNLTLGKKITKDDFAQIRVPNEDDYCIICFDEFDNTKKNNIECPVCHNILHQKCMEKWIKMGKENCVYCRSDIWKKYLNQHPTASDYQNLN